MDLIKLFGISTAVAEATGSAFLQGYVQVQIDAANLRTLVRTLRMRKSTEFLRGVLLEGGSLAPEALLSVSSNRGSGLSALYASTRFQAAADAGAEAAVPDGGGGDPAAGGGGHGPLPFCTQKYRKCE